MYYKDTYHYRSLPSLHYLTVMVVRNPGHRMARTPITTYLKEKVLVQKDIYQVRDFRFRVVKVRPKRKQTLAL